MRYDYKENTILLHFQGPFKFAYFSHDLNFSFHRHFKLVNTVYFFLINFFFYLSELFHFIVYFGGASVKRLLHVLITLNIV